jgi:hypothetical protein|tara:strand:- start:908 stop:1102 length:195 start_codon:yes stop_codon:yes gene_type:complete
MSKDETRNDPMSKLGVFEKVREGCQGYMYRLDNEGNPECDDYIVALAFFEDYIEQLREGGKIHD